MKTLTNCKPREFMRQVARIKTAAAAWLDMTRLLELRRRMPPRQEYADDEARRQAVMDQWRANIKDMVDAMLVDHPEETLELLGLICFIEPEELDEHPMSELYEGLMAVLKDDNLVDLFTAMLSIYLTPERIRDYLKAQAPEEGGGDNAH